MGGRSWKCSLSSRLSSPLYLVTQGERGLSMSLVLSHSSSSISEVNLHRVMKVTMIQAAPPTEMATMLPVSIGNSSPVFLTKVAAERHPPTTPLTRPYEVALAQRMDMAMGMTEEEMRQRGMERKVQRMMHQFL